MKSVKKIAAGVLVATLALGSTMAYATGSEEYVKMYGESSERIDKSGNFSFKIHTTVDGNDFTVKGNSATMTVNADAYTISEKKCDESVQYTAYILSGILGKKMLSVTTTTGQQGRGTTNQLEKGKKYFIRVSKPDTYDEAFYAIGSGKVTNVDKVY